MTKRVVLVHDAAIDEYMSTILLTTMEGVSLDGIVIVNADCIYGPAMDAAWKIQQYIGRTDIPLSLSGARGFNPFPWPYRADCIKQGEVAALAPYGPHPDWPPYPDGDAWLEQYLDSVPEPVILLCLCPATPIAELLKRRPELEAKIDHMIWMAGAVDVAGNLDPDTLPIANPYAEWNVFWDPDAGQWLLANTKFKITVFPLDVTDTVPVAKEFMAQLLVQGKVYRYSDLALQSYALVSDEPFYDMWDMVTTCYISRPDLFDEPQKMHIEIVTSGDKEGAMIPNKAMREVDVIMKIKDTDAYYQYVLDQFARS
ncbi:nucleoside hydrolase [Kordiimonas lipolytica]|uniref:Nucleoside hydrolase n=1 Tax=Kordiimonas lipolytica TaxID=1662421 RepID=A0ABV8UBP3_9PROT|nr:nucleoside hydrolase [Kordiimonas lipolytica]